MQKLKEKMNKINNQTCRCLKCGYRWKQRGKNTPKKCPICTNPNWNKRSTREIINLIVG
jgi:rubrerythrin